MTDSVEQELADAKEHVAALEAQAAAQTLQESPAVPPAPSGPGPREAVWEIYQRAEQDGLRNEDIAGFAVARLAQGALSGDERYIVKDAPIAVRGFPQE